MPYGTTEKSNSCVHLSESKLTEQERRQIALEAAKAINREADSPTHQNLKILGEEALVAFASEAAASHYLTLIAEGKSHEHAAEARAVIARLENSMPAEVKSVVKRLDDSGRLAFLALHEIVQIRRQAEAMGYWRMPGL